MAKRYSTLEGLGVIQFSNVYEGRRVLITGHTGFKGSWLALWLHKLGAEVAGISLAPRHNPNHWDLLSLNIKDYSVDIRDAKKVQDIVAEIRPEIVFHLAAQPLVRYSYLQPIETWSTNVIGTVHLLEACRVVGSIKGIVVITSDKVYANQERPEGYREGDRLGGHDPYSASKAACELVIDSYRNAFFNLPAKPLLASARAGNVVGGGDWSEDRLIPDVVRSMNHHNSLLIRLPSATRPWQHVLDCLSGYLVLGQKLIQRCKNCATAWNFGPGFEGNRSVRDVLLLLQKEWPGLQWRQSEDVHPHETSVLSLDHSKAARELGWKPVWQFEQALQATAEWYHCHQDQEIILSVKQLDSYLKDALALGLPWVFK